MNLLLLSVHFSGMNFCSCLGALAPEEDRTCVFNYCGVMSQTHLALCSWQANRLAADDEGAAAIVSQQLRNEAAAIDMMREVDTAHVKVVLRAGTAVTSGVSAVFFCPEVKKASRNCDVLHQLIRAGIHVANPGLRQMHCFCRNHQPFG